MRKKNPDEKKKIFDFYYTELSAVEEFFEKQELEGYRLKEFDRNIMVFEKCQPRKIRYCAEIFRGSTPDEFIESCALEGWELAARYHDELYVFRTQKTDAIDIMTDKKEKNKICAKRILRQPGTWISLVYLFSNLVRLFTRVNVGWGIQLFETDVLNYFTLFVVAYFAFITLIKVVDYFLWRVVISNSADSEKSRFFSLKNTINKRRVFNGAVSVFVIVSCFILMWISPEVFINKFSAVSVLILISLFGGFFNSFGKVGFNKKDRLKRIILNCIIILVAVCGTFAITEYAESRYAEFSKNMFSTEDIPVSLDDLGVESENIKNKGTMEGTRFGQLYRFTSDADLQVGEEGTNGYLIYQIFVSDYPRITRKYIDKILEEYSDSDCELIKVVPPETKWEYCYKAKYENGNLYDLFAVKDNVVVYVIRSEQYEKVFFEVVYKKLFNE